MESTLMSAINSLLEMFALPQVGLSAIFIVSLVSATLLPLGSEPVVFGYLSLTPHMFWPAMLVATAGNTIGGGISYAMGLGARRAFVLWRRRKRLAAAQEGLPRDGDSDDTGDDAQAADGVGQGKEGRWDVRARNWMRRIGPPALLLSWLPAVGDPLCAAAGWLRFSFWPCMFYMAIGKFLRYVLMTAFLMWVSGQALPGL
ncbi:YqaA family protein [Kerstersia gyiorum]|uniref:YqaA family protein n=1 Tax=Kerstersia gyiorum TaxID=206506 RepID=UPI003B43CE53